MPTISITNTSTLELSIGSGIGPVRPNSSRTVTLTADLLEQAGLELTRLQDAGKISFTVSDNAAVSDKAEIAVAGINRKEVGGWAEVLAASQTDNVVNRVVSTAGGYVAKRAGSITGFSAALSAAATSAAVNCRVAKNGTAITATQLDFTAGGNTTDYATFTAGTIQFVAGDVLTVVYTSLAIGNTPTLSCDIEIAD